MKYYEFLKLKRIELGYSTRQLGSKIFLSGSYISLVENGKTTTPPTEETLDKLVIALKLTEKEKEKLYNLIDNEVLPERLKKKIKELEKKINEQNKSNNEYKIISDEDKKIINELGKLTKKQKEKVLKFIDEYIK
ncbi:helix-turn-helix domain-containing protein [Cetobacterium ceti]